MKGRGVLEIEQFVVLCLEVALHEVAGLLVQLFVLYLVYDLLELIFRGDSCDLHEFVENVQFLFKFVINHLLFSKPRFRA